VKKYFSASDAEIDAGGTTDIYFVHTLEILKARKMMKQRATAEFTASALPRGWPWGVLCGVEELVRLFEGRKVDLRGLPEGTVFRSRTGGGVRVPVLTIDGPYSEYCLFETPALGFICHSSGVATMAARVKKAAGNRSVIAFGIRRMHPSISPMLDRSSYIGGCDAVSSLLGAKTIGEQPSGTMPHALIIMIGDQAEAFRAFDQVIEPAVPRVALVDTYSDEKFEAMAAAEAVPDLFGVRLDTPASRRGSMPELVREVKWELALRGFGHIRVFVSGGLDDATIPELAAAGADGFGVGTSISNAPTIDFALDIVEKEGRSVAKRGKFGGSKHAFRCPECLEYEVSRDVSEVPDCPRCGDEMEQAEVQLLKDGTRAVGEESPRRLRERVMRQLAKLKE
jgi:nicotinate phosphoribosyltransferase